MRRRLGVGLILGILLGLATSFFFLLVVVGPLLAVAISAASLREVPPNRQLSAFGAGVLVGMGTVYGLGAINTLIACQGSTEVCGGVSALPLAGVAIAVLTLGVMAAVITAIRRS